jgi:hypothetical protein
MKSASRIVVLHPEIFRVSAALTSESDGLGVAGV